MKFNLKTLLFLFLVSIPTILFSQVRDTALLRKIAKELKIKESEINTDLAADKILPYATEKTIVVIPKYRTKQKDEYGNYFYEFDAYIVVEDNRNGKILNKFYEPKAWTSDAIQLESVAVDTGLYILNDHTRAFGIRLGYSGSSRANPYNQQTLSLFIPEKDGLKRILKDFTLYDFNGESDTNCAGSFEETKSVIGIDKLKTNNFNNLSIRTTTAKIRNISTKDRCVEKRQTTQRSSKLRYNGNYYQ